MANPTAPVDGVVITLPSGHELLREAVQSSSEFLTALIAVIATTLVNDPVDLLALKRQGVLP